MEIYLFFAGPLPTKADLQQTMRDLAFPFTIKSARGSLERHSGHLPMRFERQDTGVEFDLEGGRAAIDELVRDGVEAGFDRAAALRWGGDLVEAAAAVCTAAALARLTGGTTFDPAAGVLRGADDAIAAARRDLDALRRTLPARQPVASPAAIRRLLKPILDQRPDLALVGGRLFIHPVRHLLRGALFWGARSDGTFRVSAFIRPLYLHDVPSVIGYSHEYYYPMLGRWQIDDPDLRDMIYHYLVDSILPWAGGIVTLEDYVAETRKSLQLGDPGEVESLVLAGKTTAARAELEANVHEFTEYVEERQYLVDQPFDDIVARFRPREAALVKAMKIEKFWQPCSFPGELSPEHADDANEPRFVASPWPAHSTAWRSDVPQRPGETAFAKGSSRGSMIYPLTVEDARRAHDDNECYELAARLPDRRLLTLQQIPWHLWIEYRLAVTTPGGPDLSARFEVRADRPEIIRLERVSCRDHRGTEWLLVVDKKSQKKWTRFKIGQQPAEMRTTSLLETEYQRYEMPKPAFSDVEPLVGLALTAMAEEGVGHLYPAGNIPAGPYAPAAER
jgi:hypothetical protein